MYFLLIAPYIINISVILFSFTACMFILTIVFSLLTTFKDPGIIPRYPILMAINNGVIPKKCARSETDSDENNKFCSTWKIWRPERSSHCPDCDWCVEIFDHHWPYLNNWIGKRNYRYFIGFLWSIVLNGLWIASSIFIYIFGSDDSNDDKVIVQKTFVSKIIVTSVGVLSTLFLLLIIVLWIFHIYLITKGKTTKEKLTNKATKTNSKLLFWIVRDPPNFQGGKQWLSKAQYEIYLESWKETCDELFHLNRALYSHNNLQKQRILINLINAEYINKRQLDSPHDDSHSTFYF